MFCFWNFLFGSSISGLTPSVPRCPPAAPGPVATAAGDSFNAGIFAGIANRLPLEESIDNACQLAGKVVLGKGALVPVDLDA